MTAFVQAKMKLDQKINLNFICTHNSRRSHMAQIWAQAAAYLFDIKNVQCFSGGTEATAFNERAVTAMQRVGFQIVKTTDGNNPQYEVKLSSGAPSILSFSKKYDHPSNPLKDFAAIMTCSLADENCPLVLGASARIAITYDDPKDFDDTTHEAGKYEESALQIGREMLFAFSRIKF